MTIRMSGTGHARGIKPAMRRCRLHASRPRVLVRRIVIMVLASWLTPGAFAQGANPKPISINGLGELSVNSEGHMLLLTIDKDPPDGVWDGAYVAEMPANQAPPILKKGKVSGEYDTGKALVIRLPNATRLVFVKDSSSASIGRKRESDVWIPLVGVMRLNFDQTDMTHAQFADFVFARWKKMPAKVKR
jgi:hypothetical protein